MALSRRLRWLLAFCGILAIALVIQPWLPEPPNYKVRSPRMMTMNGMRNIVQAMLMYDRKKGHLPVTSILDKDGKPLLSWRVRLLPYLELHNLYKAFHLDEPWDSPHNLTLIDKMPDLYRNFSLTEPGKTTFLMPVGKGTAFENPNQGTSLASIKAADGAAQTVLLLTSARISNRIPC